MTPIILINLIFVLLSIVASYRITLVSRHTRQCLERVYDFNKWLLNLTNFGNESSVQQFNDNKIDFERLPINPPQMMSLSFLQLHKWSYEDFFNDFEQEIVFKKLSIVKY